MTFGVSGCPGGEGVGRQRLTVTRRDSSARCEGQRGIAEPAAGPAESCQKAAGQKSVIAQGLADTGGDGLAGGVGVSSSLSRAPAGSTSGSIQHGTAYAYQKHKCRCDLCRGAETARQREWRKRLLAGKVKHRPAHPNCVPVRVRGMVYPSIAAAAAKLGICPSSISALLAKSGSADGAGLGGRAPRRQALNNVKPCRIHGRDFPSRAEAARYMGVSYTHLNRSVKEGFSVTYSQYLLRMLMQADARAARGDGREGRR